MSIAEEYREIYEKEICEDFKHEIAVYDSEEVINSYQPLSHNCTKKCDGTCNHDCYKSLGQLMRKNIVFYCYGEEEVVTNYKSGLLNNLESAIKLAYRERLPKRPIKQDGLPSEVLLDAIIQSLVPGAYKMAVRTIFRQKDNNEIKGYDLTYFTNKNGKITFWLGQAKLGDKQYCKRGILYDLIEKYAELYMSEQIYFMADKPCGLTEEGKEIATLLKRLNMLNIDKDNQTRAEKLMLFLKDEGIEICIPCLLAYENKSTYSNVSILKEKIEQEIVWVKNTFEKNFMFDKINPRLIFIIFPLEDLMALRGEGGFYDGLC